tara:strand:+ start:559 stop:705 length:147 start_codon:yes stop_codon:yes gene_type:complete
MNSRPVAGFFIFGGLWTVISSIYTVPVGIILGFIRAGQELPKVKQWNM